VLFIFFPASFWIVLCNILIPILCLELLLFFFIFFNTLDSCNVVEPPGNTGMLHLTKGEGLETSSAQLREADNPTT